MPFRHGTAPTRVRNFRPRPPHSPMNPKHYLITALLALAALYGFWFAGDAQVAAALLVFALPPVLLAIAAAHGWRRAGFTAAVLALLWFSHGTMLLYAEPQLRLQASLETLLALAIIHAACLPGIRAWRSKHEALRK